MSDAGRLIAVGDIHGEITKLRSLLDNLCLTDDDEIIFLGDYVDRGEDSRATLLFLIDLASKRDKVTLLKGNHEDMLVRACDEKRPDPNALSAWLRCGGPQTLRDFGGIPPLRLRQWLQSLPTLVETTGYYFVHAGLTVNRTAEQATEFERLWTNCANDAGDYSWGKPVICGHSIQLHGPLVRPNVICIDTGAFIKPSSRLTAVILPANPRLSPVPPQFIVSTVLGPLRLAA